MEYLWSFLPSGHWWHGHNAAFLETDYNDFFPSLDVTCQFDIHGWWSLFSIHPHVQILTVMIYWNMFFLLLYLSFNQDWLKFLEETWPWHEGTSWMCQIWKELIYSDVVPFLIEFVLWPHCMILPWTPKLVVLYVLNDTSVRTWCHLEGSMSCTEVFQGIRFFFIIVKYRNYHRCSRNQYRLMLHLMCHLLERSVKLCKDVRWTDKPPS